MERKDLSPAAPQGGAVMMGRDVHRKTWMGARLVTEKGRVVSVRPDTVLQVCGRHGV